MYHGMPLDMQRKPFGMAAPELPMREAAQKARLLILMPICPSSRRTLPSKLSGWPSDFKNTVVKGTLTILGGKNN
jgi:hypothetical protein